MPPPRVLLFATTTGYQVRAFGEAATRLGVELVFATDRCQTLDDPWRDAAIPVRFHDEDASLRRVREATATRPVAGIVAVGDRPAVLAAAAAEVLGVPGHGRDAARVAANKLWYRQRLRERRLPGPPFETVRVGERAKGQSVACGFPCVVKPLALSGSRGVIRADDAAALERALARVERLLSQRAVLARREPADELMLIEGFVDGPEFAVEGLVQDGTLRVVAVFDKPDPLDGPFFEETIYVTPSRLQAGDLVRLDRAVADAVAALGLRHGPIHAECRIGSRGVVVLELAARPIGGLCARALRFEEAGETRSYEEVLLRHATGTAVEGIARERAASAVMMIPIPRAGYLAGVGGTEAARSVPGVDDVQITAKAGQRLVPIPEGASYLGFIFARHPTPEAAVVAVRTAHAVLRFDIAPDLLMA